MRNCSWFAPRCNSVGSSCNWSVKLQLVQMRSCNRTVCAFAIQNALIPRSCCSVDAWPPSRTSCLVFLPRHFDNSALFGRLSSSGGWLCCGGFGCIRCSICSSVAADVPHRRGHGFLLFFRRCSSLPSLGGIFMEC
jgi:hypothetical protein